MTSSFFRVVMAAAAALLMGVSVPTEASVKTPATQHKSNAQVAFGGQVVSVSRMRITRGASLTVTLRDIDRTSMPVVAERSRRLNKATPMPFLVAYRPSDILKGHHYALDVVVRDAHKRPLWRSVQRYPVSFSDSGIIKGSPFILPVKRARR